jgi:hypothetical protein
MMFCNVMAICNLRHVTALMLTRQFTPSVKLSQPASFRVLEPSAPHRRIAVNEPRFTSPLKPPWLNVICRPSIGGRKYEPGHGEIDGEAEAGGDGASVGDPDPDGDSLVVASGDSQPRGVSVGLSVAGGCSYVIQARSVFVPAASSDTFIHEKHAHPAQLVCSLVHNTSTMEAGLVPRNTVENSGSPSATRM